MEPRTRAIDALLGIACMCSAGIIAWARYLHPATFSVLAYPFLVGCSLICFAVYYKRIIA